MSLINRCEIVSVCWVEATHGLISTREAKIRAINNTDDLNLLKKQAS